MLSILKNTSQEHIELINTADNATQQNTARKKQTRHYRSSSHGTF